MRSSRSFRGRIVRTLKSLLKPDWLFRRKRQQRIVSRFVRLSEASSRGIVANTVEAFRKLFAQGPARRRMGLDLGFVRLTSETLEPRRLLTGTTIYVAPTSAHLSQSVTGSYDGVSGLLVHNATNNGNTFTSVAGAVSFADSNANSSNPYQIDVLNDNGVAYFVSNPQFLSSYVSVNGVDGTTSDAINAGGTDVFQIDGSNVTISNLGLYTGSGNETILVDSNGASFKISGNILANDSSGSTPGNGITVSGGAGSISGNTSISTQGGVGIAVGSGSSVGISGNTIAGNAVGISVGGSGSATISGTDFTDAYGDMNSTDVQYDNGTLSFTGGGNQFYGTRYYIDNQTATPVDASQAGTEFGGVTPTALTLTNQTQLDEVFAIESRMHDVLSAGSSFALVGLVPNAEFVASADPSGAIGRAVTAASSGNTIYIQGGSYAENVSVGSSLTLQGSTSTAAPDSATTLTGLAVSGGTVHANDLTVSGGAGTGISVSGGTAYLSQDTVSGYTTGIDVSGGSLSATENIITGNSTGVQVDSGAGSVTLTGNSIAGNSVAGLVDDSAGSVTATGNWWGSANGPTTPLNQYASILGLTASHTGDSVSGSGTSALTIAPWLTDGANSNSTTPGFGHAAADTVAPALSGQSNQSTTEGQNPSFNLGSATDSVEPSLAVDINWGDSTSDTTFAATSGAIASKSHTYAEAQTLPYVPQLTVADQAGNVSSTTFQVTVADAALVAGTLTPPTAASLNLEGSNAVTEGVAFGTPAAPVTVFTFTDNADLLTKNSNIADYTAVIALGDGNSLTLNSGGVVGTAPTGASGQIVADPGLAANGRYDVQLSYTYAQQLLNQTFSVTVTDAHGQSASASTSAFNVADQALAPTAVPFSAVTGVAFSNVPVATFADPGGAAQLALLGGDGTVSHYYTATINWGDPGNTTTPGTITYDSVHNVFTVLGSFTYGATGAYSPVVSITHLGSPTNYPAVSVTGSATVSQDVWVSNSWTDDTHSGAFNYGDTVTTTVADSSLPGSPATLLYGVDAFGTDLASPYGTLQSAVNTVPSGGTIFVLAGTYYGNTIVNKAVDIQGANVGVKGYSVRGSESEVITNGPQNAVFTVTASGVTIEGLYITGNDPSVTGGSLTSGDNSDAYYGVETSGSVSGLTVRQDIIKDVYIGVGASGASSGNLITQNWFDSIGALRFWLCRQSASQFLCQRHR